MPYNQVGMPQFSQFAYNGAYPTASGGAVDPTTALLNAGLGYGATTWANSQQQAGANGAIGMAAYNPTGVNGPYGSVGSNGMGGYNLSATGPFSQFGNVANGAMNFAGNNLGTNQFDTAANSAMKNFQNFNEQQAAQTAYNQLASMTAPTQTAQTQQMLNYEQASGRNGLSENGVLGDMGGLALAQSMQNQSNALQANQLAQQQGNYLANLGLGFQNQGNAQRNNAMNLANTGLQGTLNVNQSLQQMLQNSIYGSQARAQAGANQGQFRYNSGLQSSNNYGNFAGGALQGLNNAGGISGLKNWWNGNSNSSSNPSGTGYDPSTGTYSNGYTPGQFGSSDYSPYVSTGPSPNGFGTTPGGYTTDSSGNNWLGDGSSPPP